MLQNRIFGNVRGHRPLMTLENSQNELDHFGEFYRRESRRVFPKREASR